jgi:hypothetical protein
MSSHSPALVPPSPDPDPATVWTHKLQEKPSALKREHPALKTGKFLIFFYICGSFLSSWIRIRIQNVDSDSDSNSAKYFIRIQ